MAKRFTFFDDKSVRRALDRGTRKALSKFGAYVRRRAKSSIRKRKKTSEPGQPPSSHTGKLRKYIYFGYDRTRRSVVIGALPFSSSRAQETLEHGGRARRAVKTFRVGGRGPLKSIDVPHPERWGRLHTPYQAARATRIYNSGLTAIYRPRPYMRPAFQKEMSALSTEMKDFLNKG